MAIDMQAATDHGVTVCGTGGAATHGRIDLGTDSLSVASYSEKIGRYEEGWQISMGVDLNGKTLGVIGLGNLGSQVATVGKAFQMNVIAWSQNLTAERAASLGAKLVSKDELLSQSDVVTIHLVLSDRTRGLLGARELGIMKPSAYVINTSRGPIIEERALVEALQNKKIAGAGLDVFDDEPLPLDHHLRHLENTIITPHIGYVTENTYKIFFDQTVENIKAFLTALPFGINRHSGAEDITKGQGL